MANGNNMNNGGDATGNATANVLLVLLIIVLVGFGVYFFATGGMNDDAANDDNTASFEVTLPGDASDDTGSAE
jgi:hypothetical protein